MNIFEMRDHREILKALINSRKSEGYSFSKLATTIGVQKTYVSRVINNEACWSSDQAFAICNEFNFNEDEVDYFCLLIEEERCGLDIRSKHIKKLLKTLRRKHLRTEMSIQAQVVESKDQLSAEYFADPYHSLVHVYLTIPKYQKTLSILSTTVGISLDHLMKIIQRLEGLGVIKYDKKNDTVAVIQTSIHSPSGTPQIQAHQELFRAFALDRLHRCNEEQKNGFTVVFAGDKNLQESIWAEFLKFLEKTEKLAKSTSPENVYYLQFDLFPWTGIG